MNNYPYIILSVEGSQLLMYIQESQLMPAVLRRNIHKNPDICHSLFIIPASVRQHSQVHPKVSPALQGAPKRIPITPILLLYQLWEIPVTPVPVVRDQIYSEGWLKCPPKVWYSPEIDASKFTLHILSDTPGSFQRLKYILLMNQYYPPHVYGHPPSQQPFPDTPQFYLHSPFNTTHNSSHPTTRVSQQYPSYGPGWQEYDLHPGGYGESHMFS